MFDNKTNKQFLPFGKPVLEEEEIQAVSDVLRSGWITTGPKTAEFQKLFSEYVGMKRALGLSSCTAGLFLGLKIFGIKEGDEVILPTMTFTATANVIVHCGAVPVFVDVDLETGNMIPEAFEKAITPRTKAVMPVHLYGRPAEIEKIYNIAKKNNLYVIADCAHATESRINDLHVASFSDAAAFSFYATKNLAVGEGGMLVSDNEEIMEKAGVLFLHGMSKGAFSRYSASGFKMYDIVDAGYKFNMTDISASLGIEQLKRLEKRLKKREEIWRRYDEAFFSLPVKTPPLVPDGIKHARHLYTLRVQKNRDKILSAIQDEGVGVSIHFTALHLHSFYQQIYGYKRGMFPNAENISDTTFSIPMTPYLTDEEVERVIATVRKAVELHYNRDK